MTSPYDLFKNDPEAETQGIVLDYGDFEIRIKRAGGANRAFTRGMSDLMEKHGRQIDAGTLEDEADRRIMCELYVEHVILGWERMTDEKRNPLEFSRENAVKLFMDLPDLFRDVVRQANREANFRAKKLQDKAGNSRGRSAGSSSGATKQPS